MRATGVLALIISLTSPASGGQDPLAAAKNLYAAASYEDALAALAKVIDGAPASVARQAYQYQAFTLFALGRTAEAEQTAEMWVRIDPLGRLNPGEASPRLEAMFAAARKRVLPLLLRDEYRAAHDAIEHADMEDAEPHLVRARQLIDEVRATGGGDATLTDLALIIDGFLGLAKAAARPSASPDPAHPPAPVDPPPGAAASAAARPRTAAAGPISATPAPAAIIHSGPGTTHLVPPVAISQIAPEVPRAIGELLRGTTKKVLVVELLIDERGNVENARLVEPVQPLYDQLMLRAARQWKYQPATFDGTPVKFRRAVSIDLR